jgi:hypothetical protein
METSLGQVSQRGGKGKIEMSVRSFLVQAWKASFQPMEASNQPVCLFHLSSNTNPIDFYNIVNTKSNN